MPSQRIGSRGILVSFDDPFYTNVYIIFGDEHVFVLDTFLGNDSMKVVQRLIKEEGCARTPVVVFNSHADYDHYWGNGAFGRAIVIGHELCRERILNEGKASLTKYTEHQRGEVQLVPPNQTFQDVLSFNKEQIRFIHSPGHTLDSSTCVDQQDRVLFVGDNVESPIPYLNHANFDDYISTLESYLEIDWKYLIAGHDPLLETTELLNQNIEYLRKFRNWNLDFDSFSREAIHRHIDHNIKAIEDELMQSSQKHQLMKHLGEMQKYIT